MGLHISVRTKLATESSEVAQAGGFPFDVNFTLEELYRSNQRDRCRACLLGRAVSARISIKILMLQASTMGTKRRIAVSVRSCGICNQELPASDYRSHEHGKPDIEVVQLSCKHLFHAFCIRGEPSAVW